MEEFKMIVEVAVPFYSYGTKRKDRAARSQIKRWILESMKGRCVPLYVEGDESGAYIEDATRPVRCREVK